jgi:adenylate cyclase
VLPFENSSGDPAQDGLAGGITRDVTDLAANTIDVVPALTAASYRGKTFDLRTIGREHDVHFALTGNARRQDGRLIVSATLYQIADAQLVWSRRFDRPDSPEALNRLIQDIYENVYQTGVDVEAERALHDHPDSLDKRDLMMAALATPLTQPSKAAFLARITLVERALVVDPNYFLALQYEARLRAGLVMNGYSSDPAADLVIAAKAADRMLELRPNELGALRAKAAVLRAQGNWDEAAAFSRQMIELQPLESTRHSEYGFVLMAQGHHKQALEQYMIAKQLAAGTDPVYSIDAGIAAALVANDQFPEAIALARLSIQEFPPDSGRGGETPWLALIAAESANGQDAEARANLQKFLATPRTLRTMAEIEKLPSLAANPKLLEGLRRAGMPAE